MTGTMNVAKNELINGFNVSELCGGVFIAVKDDVRIRFVAEGRNGGIYTNIDLVTNNNRYYRARRYHYKYINLIQSIGFQLLKNNMLWDYVAQCPALASYEKAIAPYHQKCKDLGLSF